MILNLILFMNFREHVSLVSVLLGEKKAHAKNTVKI